MIQASFRPGSGGGGGGGDENDAVVIGENAHCMLYESGAGGGTSHMPFMQGPQPGSISRIGR